METNLPGIWALGDVKGGPAFTHISYNDYQIVYANIIDGKNLTIENRYLPYSLFTDPQLGRVGMTEKAGPRIWTRKLENRDVSPWRACHRVQSSAARTMAGFMKIIVDAETDRILGATILGIEGGESVQVLGALMLADAPYTIFGRVRFSSILRLWKGSSG